MTGRAARSTRGRPAGPGARRHALRTGLAARPGGRPAGVRGRHRDRAGRDRRRPALPAAGRILLPGQCSRRKRDVTHHRRRAGPQRDGRLAAHRRHRRPARDHGRQSPDRDDRRRRREPGAGRQGGARRRSPAPDPQAIDDYRATAPRPPCAAPASTAFLATLILVVGVGLLLWVWRRLDALAGSAACTRTSTTVGIQSFEVMRADRIWSALRSRAGRHSGRCSCSPRC